MFGFVALLFSCLCMAFLLFKMKVPGGILVGAVLGSALVHVFFPSCNLPVSIKVIAQLIAGTFIGSSLERKDLTQIKKCVLPSVIMLGSLLLLNLLLGLTLWKIGLSDLLTCMMCVIPGGASDVGLMAIDMGADVSIVIVMHFCRMLAGVGLFPILIQYIARENTNVSTQSPSSRAVKESLQLSRFLVVILCSSILGCGAKTIGVPAGALVFSMITALIFKLSGYEFRFPRRLKRAAQLMSGAYIGTMLEVSSLSNPGLMCAAIVISILSFMLCAYFVGRYYQNKWGIPLKEGMLIMTPAGASDMSLISHDIGVMSSRLVLLHIIRLITVTAFFPYICSFLAAVIE